MKPALIGLITLSMLATAVSGEPAAAAPQAARHDAICRFEHEILPDWTHHSSGRFFADLQSGLPADTTAYAQQVVDPQFAAALKLKAYPQQQACAFIFPRPEKPPECYFAIIRKEAEGFSYFTLEKGLDLFGLGTGAVLCKWTKDGTHQNLGTRDYDDLASFAKEVLK